jgi:hypothetical protein
VDAGESPEVDQAVRALNEERERYEHDIRQFIATCGR